MPILTPSLTAYIYFQDLTASSPRGRGSLHLNSSFHPDVDRIMTRQESRTVDIGAQPYRKHAIKRGGESGQIR